LAVEDVIEMLERAPRHFTVMLCARAEAVASIRHRLNRDVEKWIRRIAESLPSQVRRGVKNARSAGEWFVREVLHLPGRPDMIEALWRVLASRRAIEKLWSFSWRMKWLRTAVWRRSQTLQAERWVEDKSCRPPRWRPAIARELQREALRTRAEAKFAHGSYVPISLFLPSTSESAQDLAVQSATDRMVDRLEASQKVSALLTKAKLSVPQRRVIGLMRSGGMSPMEACRAAGVDLSIWRSAQKKLRRAAMG